MSIKDRLRKFLFSLKNLSKNKDKQLQSNQNQILNNTVEEVLIPRPDVCAIRVTDNLKKICNTFIATGHTRILVYKEDLDDIIGFLHLKDVFKVVATGDEFDINLLIRKLIITTQSQKILGLFEQMRQSRVHIAVVIDEYGGTKGIVTIEDIIEKQLGQKIADEHDEFGQDIDDIVFIDDYYIVSGRTKIDELEKVLQIDLSTDDQNEYETIAGLIISQVGYVPKKDEKIIINNKIICFILEATDRAILKIKISFLQDSIV